MEIYVYFNVFSQGDHLADPVSLELRPSEHHSHERIPSSLLDYSEHHSHERIPSSLLDYAPLGLQDSGLYNPSENVSEHSYWNQTDNAW